MVADALSRQAERGQFDSFDTMCSWLELADSDAPSDSEMFHCDHSDFSLFCLDNDCGLFLIISFPYPT